MKRMKVVVSCVAVMILASVMARADDNASITGKAVFDGPAPKAKKIKTDADPQCAAMHADSPLMSEDAEVGAGGGLQNVFVYVKSGVTGDHPCPKEPVTINQKGCHYDPHVFGMHTGQLLLIKNSDDTLHNIHAMPDTDKTGNKDFNNAQPASAADLKKTFQKPEVMVKFKCDVHPWMSAYVGVLDHPFFAVTGADGTFTIKGLPAGDYEVEAWHEKFGTQTAKIKVGAGEAKTADFKFAKAAE